MMVLAAKMTTNKKRMNLSKEMPQKRETALTTIMSDYAFYQI